MKANVAYCLIVEIVSSFRSCTSCAFSWRYCRFDCHSGTSGEKQFKPSSLAIGGLEFVIFRSTLLFYLFLDQAAKILGEKKKNYSCVMKMLFSTKNSCKGQLKSQQNLFLLSCSKDQERSRISYKL